MSKFQNEYEKRTNERTDPQRVNEKEIDFSEKIHFFIFRTAMLNEVNKN